MSEDFFKGAYSNIADTLVVVVNQRPTNLSLISLGLGLNSSSATTLKASFQHAFRRSCVILYSKKRVKLHLTSQLDSVRQDRFNGSFRLTFSMSLLGRLPTDAILRPPAA